MLTKKDLKNISNLIDERFNKKFDEKVEIKFKLVNKSIKALENRMIKKFNDVVDFFDDRVVDHESRIRNLESRKPVVL